MVFHFIELAIQVYTADDEPTLGDLLIAVPNDFVSEVASPAVPLPHANLALAQKD